MRLLVVLATLAYVSAIAELYRGRPELDQHWKEFKSKHQKSYASSAREAVRRKIWEETHDTIEKHNSEAASGKHTFTMEVNHLADLTKAEKRNLLGRKSRNTNTGQRLEVDLSELERISPPASLDLSNHTCMPPVKDQGHCGSCWAFAATTPVEFTTCKAKGTKIILSEQQLVDCVKTSSACNGGFEQYAWQYLITAPGQASSAVYPYTSGTTFSAGTCKYVKTMSSATISSYYEWFLPRTNLTAMKSLLFTKGPLTTAMEVLDSFQYYASGVYTEPNCSTEDFAENHSVVLVGYGNLNGTDYWIVRNSWGASWGKGGYFFIRRGVNMCSIEANVSYPNI